MIYLIVCAMEQQLHTEYLHTASYIYIYGNCKPTKLKRSAKILVLSELTVHIKYQFTKKKKIASNDLFAADTAHIIASQKWQKS